MHGLTGPQRRKRWRISPTCDQHTGFMRILDIFQEYAPKCRQITKVEDLVIRLWAFIQVLSDMGSNLRLAFID
jgi:hypothetical protein